MALVLLGRQAYKNYKNHKNEKAKREQGSPSTSWDQLQSCNETSICTDSHSTQQEHHRRSSSSSWDQLQSCNEDLPCPDSRSTQQQRQRRSSMNMDQIQTSYTNSPSPYSRSHEETGNLHATSVRHDKLAKTPSPKLPQRAPGHQYPAPPYRDASSVGKQQKKRDM
jgi:hypothetical protein